MGTPEGDGGSTAGEPPAADKSGGDTPPAKAAGDSRRTKQIVAGAAIGIGSAALVAALLYANRSKKNERGGDGS